MLDSLSPQRRRLVVGAAAAVVVVVVAVVATLLVRTVAPTAEPVPQDRPGPVLLVPGYGGDTSSLAPLETALRATGRTVRVVAPEDSARSRQPR